MNRRKSVQAAYVRLDRIDHDTVRLEGGACRAVLEVTGIPFDQQGRADQERVLAGYAAFLNSLAFPVQVLVRVTPADLEPYLARLERQANLHAGNGLAALAQDHAAFLRRLGRQRTLLERRSYLVVPAGEESLGGWRSWWPLRRNHRGGGHTAAAQQQLALRCDEVVREVGRCGLEARRLQDTELAQLWYACWCPDLARTQRLRRDLQDYVTLVVGGPQRRGRTES